MLEIESLINVETLICVVMWHVGREKNAQKACFTKAWDSSLERAQSYGRFHCTNWLNKTEVSVNIVGKGDLWI